MDEERQNWLFILIGIVALIITGSIVQLFKIGSKYTMLILWGIYCLELGLVVYGAVNFSRLQRWIKIALTIITTPLLIYLFLLATVLISRAVGVY